MSLTHTALVDRQFGAQATAYLGSAVHAQGADLQQLSALACQHPMARVLDVGCGGGHVAYAMAPHVAQVVACDLSLAMLDVVRAEAQRRALTNLAVVEGGAQSLPFADARFDGAVSRYSAHHWPDAFAGLQQVARVVKPGGFAVFIDVIAPESTPADTFLQTVEMLRDPSHVRDYRLKEWLAMLTHAGLEPRAVRRDRLGLEFSSWVARMRTDPAHVAALRSLQAGASQEVRRCFDLQPDGSLTVDTVWIEAIRV